MNNICDIEECTGCCACLNSCPTQSIRMVENDYGHLIPEINEEKCIDCEKCKRICPVNNEIKRNYPIKAYAVINKDREDRKNSASGGVATVLSKNIIRENGSVFGCMVSDNQEVIHKAIYNMDEIEKLKGSKYVQSYIGKIYSEVKNELSKGKYVLFIGTPCQVAGLLAVVGNSNEKLITVDLICHGVPPIRYVKEHINKVNRKKLKITDIKFRGENDFYFTLYSGKSIIYKKSREEDSYFLGFLKGLFYRDSCFKCKYARAERCSDITIGDFWGLGDSKVFIPNKSDRISVALINTEKGSSFFDSIKEDLIYEERKVEEAINGNSQLKKPSVRHINADRFKPLYLKYGFEKAAKKCLNPELRKHIIKSKIKKILSIVIKKYR